MIHQLKINANYFEDIASGNKTFEVRKNDRNFMVGDYLALNELTQDPINEDGKRTETGRSCLVYVSYICEDSSYCKEGYIVMGIVPCEIHIKYQGNICPVYDFL